MERPTHRPVPQPPVDAQFIELPETQPEQTIATPPPVVEKKLAIPAKKPIVSKAVPVTETLAPKSMSPMPIAPTPLPAPVSPKAEPIQTIETPVAPSVAPIPIAPRAIPTPAIEAPPVVQADPTASTPAPEPTPPPKTVSPPASETAPKPPAPASTPFGQGTDSTSAIVNSGARAIARPMPRIPDDLRDEAFDSVARARFHIAVDGSITVELVRPTQNPRINRILLDTLKNWKFSPAIKNGKPVASTEEIVIRVNVD